MYEPKCKVCKSSHRAEYHRLRIQEKKTYKQLEEHARSMGENISDASFQRHFARHLESNISQSIRSRNTIEVERDFFHSILSELFLLIDEKIAEDVHELENSENEISVKVLAEEIDYFLNLEVIEQYPSMRSVITAEALENMRRIIRSKLQSDEAENLIQGLRNYYRIIELPL